MRLSCTVFKIFWVIFRKLKIFPVPRVFVAPIGGWPHRNFSIIFGARKLDQWVIVDVVCAMICFDRTSTWDGRTDTRHCIYRATTASRGKKMHVLQITRRFWATVCKTVRPMLSERCPVCLSICLFVTLVYCGQTVDGWMDQDETCHAGRPRPWPHCVRWGSSSPFSKGHSLPPPKKKFFFDRHLLWPDG